MAPVSPSDRVARFQDADGRPRLAWVLGGETVDDAELQPVVGDLFGELRAEGARLPAGSVRLLPPLLPSKVVGIGSNYKAHAAEMGRALPSVPKIFLKPSTAVIGHGDTIEIPPVTTRVDHEAELALVIGRTLSRVPVEHALDGVLGVTCLCDVTARDFQRADGTFARGKGFDSFCPIGPWITRRLDPRALDVRCHVLRDGAWRCTQDGNSSDMVFSPAELVSFVSSVMTLLPGDVIATGTPAGVGPLLAGDRVRVQVEGVGVLENAVADRADRRPGA